MRRPIEATAAVSAVPGFRPSDFVRPAVCAGRLRLPAVVVALCAFALALSSSAHAFRESTDRVPATGVVEVAFTPGDAADRLVAETVLRARYQILVQAFSFTHRKIADALAAARRRGVDVQVLVDAKQLENGFAPVVPRLAGAGVAVFVDGDHEAAHNKVMVIDPGTPDAAVITGSYNFTWAAQTRNAENLILFRSNPALADVFRANWQQHLRHARPYR